MSMFYEDYRPPRRRERRPRREQRRRHVLSRFLFKLIMFALLLIVAAGAVLYYLPVSVLQVEPDFDLGITAGLPSEPINILLLGVDTLNDAMQRSDTMIVASIGKNALKLTSLQRDTMVDIEGYGRGKLNSAYSHGGAELAVKTVNSTFGMNIVHYVVADFTVLVRMIDALGGIYLEVEDAEIAQINRNVVLSAKVFKPLGYNEVELTQENAVRNEAGEMLLDGLRALAFSRIRKLDSDFMRTSRQRRVLAAMLRRLKAEPMRIPMLVEAALSGLQTDMDVVQLAMIGLKAIRCDGVETLRLPCDGSFEDDGSGLRLTDATLSIAEFRRFVYGH